MKLVDILFLAGLALLLRLLLHNRFRLWGILIVSVFVLYRFQPISIIRYLDFWLPTLTLLLILFCWVIITPVEKRVDRINWLTAFLLAIIVIIIACTRYLSPVGIITASRPPSITKVIPVILIASFIWINLLFRKKIPEVVFTGGIIWMIFLFVILKSPVLTVTVNKIIQSISGSVNNLSNPVIDVRWFGYSYIAFRLIHTIRDRQNNRYKDVNLLQYIVYVIFFPALAAGPIDRIEKFIDSLRNHEGSISDDFVLGGKRIVLGLFKKFVIADSLSIFALNSINALQVKSPIWAWVMLYSYAMVIYFDFSGYTDIAVGLGRLIGVKLPENFNKPYLQTNLTQFWNSWHISLTQWFRAYYFNPLTRKLVRSSTPLSAVIIILITQVTTMVLIGLWHGISVNFVIWGLWHGIGLFLHNRWANWTGTKSYKIESWKGGVVLLRLLGIFVTFNYVTLGWIWFVLQDIGTVSKFSSVLFGIN